MAIYNNWTDAMTLDQLNADFKEIYKGISGVSVSEIETLASGTNGFTVDFGNNNSIRMATGGTYCGVIINSAVVNIGGSYNLNGAYFKYYAKTNGEMLIATTMPGYGSVQWGIGKTSDGDWGAVCIGRSSSSSAYDSMIATGRGVANVTPRYVTNKSSTDTNYIALRRCVKHTDVMFENIFVHTSGAPNQFVRFDMNGDQYVTGTNMGDNNNLLIMKL